MYESDANVWDVMSKIWKALALRNKVKCDAWNKQTKTFLFLEGFISFQLISNSFCQLSNVAYSHLLLFVPRNMTYYGEEKEIRITKCRREGRHNVLEKAETEIECQQAITSIWENWLKSKRKWVSKFKNVSDEQHRRMTVTICQTVCHATVQKKDSIIIWRAQNKSHLK